jgi:hypothetical protein
MRRYRLCQCSDFFRFLPIIFILFCLNNLWAEPDSLWSRTYGGIETDIGNSLIHCSSGGFLIVGETDFYGAVNRDLYIVRTDSLGDTLCTL